MAQIQHRVGPRKVVEVHKSGNTTTERVHTIDSVSGDGGEQDFIAAFRVYDVLNYAVKEMNSTTLLVEWKMGNKEEYDVTYTV